MTTSPLLVDLQERPSGVPEKLRALVRPASVVIEQRLETGDYALYDIDGKFILFERKAWPDLLASIADNRLAEQTDRLRRDCDLAVIILEDPVFDLHGKVAVVEGEIHPWRRGRAVMAYRETGWAISSAVGALWAVVWGAGIPVIPSANTDMTARIIATAWAGCQRESVGDNRRWKGTRWSHHEDGLAEAYAAVLPNVGPQTAGKLAERFGCWQALVEASEKELQEVEGIGKVVAKRIWETLHDVKEAVAA